MAIFTTALGLTAATTIAGVGVSAAGAALTAGTLALAGTAYSVSQAEKGASAQRAAAATQQRIQQQQATRQRRQAIRGSIIRRQQAAAQAQAAGVADTSMVAGGLTSLSSQLGSNLGFGTMLSGLGAQYSALTGQAAMFGARSQMGATLGQLGFQILDRIGLPRFGQAATPTPASAPSYARMGGFETGRGS